MIKAKVKVCFIVFLTFALLHLLGTLASALELELLATNTSLPAPGFGLRSAYDGSDSVYVFGAQPSLPDAPALHYSIGNDQIQKLQEAGFLYGGMALDDDGFLYYFGGQTMFGGIRTEVWKMNATHPMDRHVVARFPRPIRDAAAVWDNAENIYVFGGTYAELDNENYDVYRFSRVTHQLEVVAQLPAAIRTPSAVRDGKNQKIYIFGGHPGQDFSSDIIQFDLTQNAAVVHHVSLQQPVNYSCAVWTGKDAYIIGGAADSNGIQRFNPESGRVAEIYVANFPTGFWGPSCVYARKLNRIYIFGGEMRAGIWMRQILYIELRPEEGVNCNGIEDGTNLADPYCCRSFYQCTDGTAFLHHCPEGLLYSLADSICVSEELATCRIRYDAA